MGLPSPISSMRHVRLTMEKKAVPKTIVNGLRKWSISRVAGGRPPRRDGFKSTMFSHRHVMHPNTCGICRSPSGTETRELPRFDGDGFAVQYPVGRAALP